MSGRAARPAEASPSQQRRSVGTGWFLARHTRAETFNDIVFIGLLLTLAWVPFRFGSNHLIAWGINAALLGAMLVAFEAGLVVAGQRHPVAPRRLWWAAALLSGLVAWILFQSATWSPVAWHSSIWQLANDVLATDPAAPPLIGRISVTPDQGMLGLVRLLTAAAAFYLALQLCRDSRRAELMLWAIVVVVTAYAAYGLIQLIFFPKTLLWITKPAYLSFVTSTFINRNTFATYAGIGLIAAIGLLIDRFRRAGAGREAPVTHRIAAGLDAAVRGLPLIVAAMIITIALLWTASRAGVVSSLIGVVVLLVLILAMVRRQLLVLSAVGVALVLMAVALMSYGEALSDRLETNSGTDTRLAVTRRTFEAALDALWTGHGYGSFDRMFAVYRDIDFVVHWHWDKAHNTYVELLFELGLPATLAFFALIIGLVALLLVNVIKRQSKPILSLIALSVSVQVFLHATVDFSLQIQAVTITYWAILGAGLAQSWSRRIDTSA